LPPQQRNVAYLFQDYALFPHLTCARTSASACARLAQPRARAKTAEGRYWLDAFHLQELAHQFPTSCPAASASGWRWRARSWPQPAALLLDEPFAALDPALLRACAWN
jgi:molybdate transport system ATP-binding protein